MKQNSYQENNLKISPVRPVELLFDRISVQAEVVSQVTDENGKVSKVDDVRNILKECSGKFAPNTFTAIVGPSGCGKTTMLNLLSGRLLSKNLTLYGNLFINGNRVNSIGTFKNLIGYVMQDDLILPTFTPRQTFKFVADLRLGNKTEEEKVEIVDELLNALGLKKCADTYVGNSLIRGISGGERKRTSIGMQLLVNPSLIFLDEPTTGLDSTTALNLIRLLKNFANNGRTIISTIHQPSSQIFQEFQRLMLMVDGNVIYNGDSASSIRYFGRINMGVPVHTNPIDHYMKMMNKEGIALNYIEKGEQYTDEQVKKEFEEKVQFLVENFKKNEEKVEIGVSSNEVVNIESASWGTQFCRIAGRAFKNEFRNPIALRGKLLQMLFFAIISVILFERIADNQNSFVQNLRGVIFFLCMNVGLPSTFGTLNVFNIERPVFIRERQSNTYTTSSYFFGRSFSYIPQDIVLPLLLIVITYFVVHLNETAGSFFFSFLSLFLISWMGSAYGLFISTLFEDSEVAMALVPILVLPFLLVGGFFAPLSEVPDFYKLFEYLSMFKYGYEGFAYAQFYDGFTATGTYNGTDYTYTFTSEDYDSIFKFEDPYWLNFMMMAIIGLVFRIFALIAMYIISNPKTIQLVPVQGERQKQSKFTQQGSKQKLYLQQENKVTENEPIDILVT